jgi:hypothetical protein
MNGLASERARDVICAPVGHRTSGIKPDDLVRTPSGATGTVVAITRDGRRELRLLNGESVELRPALLYLVWAAEPKPWPDARGFYKTGRR